MNGMIKWLLLHQTSSKANKNKPSNTLDHRIDLFEFGFEFGFCCHATAPFHGELAVRSTKVVGLKERPGTHHHGGSIAQGIPFFLLEWFALLRPPFQQAELALVRMILCFIHYRTIQYCQAS